MTYCTNRYRFIPVPAVHCSVNDDDSCVLNPMTRRIMTKGITGVCVWENLSDAVNAASVLMIVLL